MYIDNDYSKRDYFAADIELVRVATVNAYRNGLSIISARNLSITNCSFVKTSGTPPMAVRLKRTPFLDSTLAKTPPEKQPIN